MASKRRIRRRSCSSKIRYSTEQAAQQAKSDLRSRKPGRISMHYYKCKFCGGFHIGHMPQQMLAGLREKHG